MTPADAFIASQEVRERLVDKAALQSLMELLQHSDRYMKAAAHSIIQELSYRWLPLPAPSHI